MNPVCQIGRYQLPILNIVAIQKRTGWKTRLGGWINKWLGLTRRQNLYDVVLSNGHTIHFTEEEKRLYDEAMEDHMVISQVYGMCRGLGLRT